MANGDNPVVRRPAETAGIAGSVAILVARVAGVTDADTIVALAAVLGFLPAAVTWTVALVRNRGGKTPVK